MKPNISDGWAWTPCCKQAQQLYGYVKEFIASYLMGPTYKMKFCPWCGKKITEPKLIKKDK
jgi:hypothetical protein